MPKTKEVLKLIPKIYQKSFENIALYFWVEGQKKIIPGITLEQSIQKFLTFTDMDLDMETAKTIYCRMQKEYLNGQTS